MPVLSLASWAGKKLQKHFCCSAICTFIL
jgi:hypothetical protein